MIRPSYSFKLSSTRSGSTTNNKMSRLALRKEHSANTRVAVAKPAKTSSKNKDYFGSK